MELVLRGLSPESCDGQLVMSKIFWGAGGRGGKEGTPGFMRPVYRYTWGGSVNP